VADRRIWRIPEAPERHCRCRQSAPDGALSRARARRPCAAAFCMTSAPRVLMPSECCWGGCWPIWGVGGRTTAAGRHGLRRSVDRAGSDRGSGHLPPRVGGMTSFSAQWPWCPRQAAPATLPIATSRTTGGQVEREWCMLGSGRDTWHGAARISMEPEMFATTLLLRILMKFDAVYGGEEMVVDRWCHHLLVLLLVCSPSRASPQPPAPSRCRPRGPRPRALAGCFRGLRSRLRARKYT
jgi:hypothetical protein